MKRLIKYIILFVFVCVGNVTWAEEGERESSLFPDSSYVLRGPKADFLEKYRKDAAFDYTTNIEDSPSIWDWIKRWILERLFRIKVSEGSMQTMDIILKIVLGLFALGIVYLLVRNRDKFLFRKRETDFPQRIPWSTPGNRKRILSCGYWRKRSRRMITCWQYG